MEAITTSVSWDITIMAVVLQMGFILMLFTWIKQSVHLAKMHDFAACSPQEEDIEMACIEERQADKDAFFIIMHQIGRDWKALVHRLLPDSDAETIIQDYQRDGMKEMMYQALVKWKQQQTRNATVRALAEHLEEVDRKDIANKIWENEDNNDSLDSCETQSPTKTVFSWTPDKDFRHIGSINPFKKELLIHAQQDELKPRYLATQMAGLPWMDDVALSLDGYYVDLKMVKEDAKGRECQSEEVNLPEIFEPVEGNKHPSRILIEGGPGFGKTTLVTKIAQDWAKNKSYVLQYDLVLTIQLRNYRGNLEDMLLKAAGVEEGHRDILLSIFYDTSKKILLMLDGFDELPEEQEANVLALLRSDIPQHVTVLVTSRPGKFTSNRKTKEENVCTPDIRTSGNYFLDKRVSIKGLVSKEQQEEFVQKHTEGNSEKDVNSVKRKLESMVEKEFLECPLFLLTFIVLFTNDNGDNKPDENTTKTDLFKQVFNYVVRRYFSKRYPDCPQIDLFAQSRHNALPEQVQLLNEFGQFALIALKSERLVYTKKEILEHELNFNPDILELGFLQQSVYVEGFREEIQYQPVHKTLFEFAAAYHLWVKSMTDQTDEWKKVICSVRPQSYAADRSLLFSFLIGLFGENCRHLFQALFPYASEYTHCFGPLGISMMQTELTPAVLMSIKPFLPSNWIVPWSSDDCGFSMSLEHEKLLQYSTAKKKTKQLTWSLNKPARFPSEFPELRKIEIIVKPPVASLEASHYKKFRCTELLCSINSSQAFYDDWMAFLLLIPSIQYRYISFYFPPCCCSLWLPRIHSAVTKGCLRESKLQWITFAVDGIDDPPLMDNIIELIQKEKIGALRMVISLDQFSNNNNPPHVTDDCKSAMQEGISKLVACIAKSSALKRLTLTQESSPIYFTVDISALCDNGKKSWEGVNIEGVDARCYNIMNNSFQIKYLELPSVSANYSYATASLISYCKVTSLAYSRASVVGALGLSLPLYDALNELQIRVDNDLFDHGLAAVLRHFKHVQVVALGLPYSERPTLKEKLSIDETCFLRSLESLELKRLEVWWRPVSHQLAKVLVRRLIWCMKEVVLHQQCCEEDFKKVPAILSVQRKLQLQYLSLHTDETGECESVIKRFISLALCCKKALTNRLVPKLEFICRHEFAKNMARLRPDGVYSWVEIFRPEDGFLISDHLWGTNPDDSIWGKEINNMAHMNIYHVFTVRLHHLTQ